MIDIQFPEGTSSAEWEDLGYVVVVLATPVRSTSVTFYARSRLTYEIEGSLARTGCWDERNVVVVEPFTEAEVRRYLEQGRESGFAAFW